MARVGAGPPRRTLGLAVGVSDRRARASCRARQSVISRQVCGSAQIFTDEIEECAQPEGSSPEKPNPQPPIRSQIIEMRTNQKKGRPVGVPAAVGMG